MPETSMPPTGIYKVFSKWSILFRYRPEFACNICGADQTMPPTHALGSLSCPDSGFAEATSTSNTLWHRSRSGLCEPPYGIAHSVGRANSNGGTIHHQMTVLHITNARVGCSNYAIPVHQSGLIINFFPSTERRACYIIRGTGFEKRLPLRLPVLVKKMQMGSRVPRGRGVEAVGRRPPESGTQNTSFVESLPASDQPWSTSPHLRTHVHVPSAESPNQT